MNRSENQCGYQKIWVTLIFCKLNQLTVQIKVVFLRRYAFGFNLVHMYQEKKIDVYIIKSIIKRGSWCSSHKKAKQL